MPSTPLGDGIRVLIVDDERDTVMTLGILLRSEGFDVRMAQDGGTVPAAVAEFRPHAVLLDLGMPERNGYAVALDLHKRYGSGCPVLIALTAHSSDVHRRAARICGFRHHVAKPYDPDRVLGLLATLRAQPRRD